MAMSEKDYIFHYYGELLKDLDKILTIANNSEHDELTKDENKKVMGLCQNIEHISTLINNKAYNTYINQ